MEPINLTRLQTALTTWKGKVLCKFGIHRWSWKFERGTTIKLSEDAPAHARCDYCNKIKGK